MTERKRLSLSRKPKLVTTVSDDESASVGTVSLKKKRVVLIDKPKPATKPAPPKRKKPKKPPSTIRVNELDASLGKLSKAWRANWPLMLGIEKQIFKAIADGELSASKRVVRALLKKKTTNTNYLRNSIVGPRYDLQDKPVGEVLPAEAAYALKLLRQLTD